MSKHQEKFQQRATALFERNIANAVSAVEWLREQPDHTAIQREVEAHLGTGATQVRTVCVLLGWVRVTPGSRPYRWNLTKDGLEENL